MYPSLILTHVIETVSVELPRIAITSLPQIPLFQAIILSALVDQLVVEVGVVVITTSVDGNARLVPQMMRTKPSFPDAPGFLFVP